MSKLRLIQAGVAGYGKGWATRSVPQSPDFDPPALVPLNPVTLHAVGEQLGVPPARRFTQLADAIAAVPADALLTVTPPSVHLEHARLAFAAGLHVMTEKPLADTIASSRAMVELARQADRQLLVAQNYRYAKIPAHLRSLIAAERVGAVGHGHIDFYIPADFTGTFREAMPHVLLVDMAIHHVDLLRYLTGRNVVAVFAQTFRPPWSWYQHNPGLKMMLTLEGNIPFTYSGDWSACGRNTSWNGDWRIQCAGGSLHWSYDRLSIARSSRGFQDDTAIEDVAVPPVERENQLALLHSFATSIRTGQPGATSGVDNLQSFGTIMAAVRSAETGATVCVADMLA